MQTGAAGMDESDYVMGRHQERLRRQADSMMGRITGSMKQRRDWIAQELASRAGLGVEAAEEGNDVLVARAIGRLEQGLRQDWRSLAQEYWHLRNLLGGTANRF